MVGLLFMRFGRRGGVQLILGDPALLGRGVEQCIHRRAGADGGDSEGQQIGFGRVAIRSSAAHRAIPASTPTPARVS